MRNLLLQLLVGFIIFLFTFLLINTIFFPEYFDPGQTYAKNKIKEKLADPQNSDIHNQTKYMAELSMGYSYVYEPIYKNITVVGKGDGFFGIYSCKILGNDAITYKVYGEENCMILHEKESYTIKINRVNGEIEN